MMLRYIFMISFFLHYSCLTNGPLIGSFETGIHPMSRPIGTRNSQAVNISKLLKPYLGLSEDELTTLPEVQIIDPKISASWGENLINKPNKRIFLLKPGNYQAWGTLHITRSGTKVAPRLFLYYNPILLSPLLPRHPVDQDGSELVGIRRFRLSGTDYCLINNLTFGPEEMVDDEININVLAAKADHNIINRCLMQGSDRTALHIQASDYNTIENCVIRNTVQRPGADNVGILLFGERSESNYNKILNNEIYNCTQGIQLGYRKESAPLGFCSGTIIENNDIYITSDLYQITGDDTLACAELGIVLKIGGKNVQDSSLVKIINNRIWGFRKTDLSCSGSGGTQGVGIQLTDYADNVIVRDNKVFDLSMGIKITTKNPETYRTKIANIAILNNLIFDIRKRSSFDNPVGIFASGSADIMYNTVANSVEGIQFDDASKRQLNRLVQCNNFLNIDQVFYMDPSSSNRLRLNVVYTKRNARSTSVVHPSKVPDNIYLDESEEIKLRDYSFVIKQWTDPTEVKVKEVVPINGFDFSNNHFEEQCDCTAEGNGNRWWSLMYFGNPLVKRKN